MQWQPSVLWRFGVSWWKVSSFFVERALVLGFYLALRDAVKMRNIKYLFQIIGMNGLTEKNTHDEVRALKLFVIKYILLLFLHSF